MLFVGVTNHWVTLIAHKTRERCKDGKSSTANIQLYLMDSLNNSQLHAANREVPDQVLQRIKQQADLGMKVMDRFSIKTCIQSIFDLRRLLTILSDVFLTRECNLLPKYYSQVQIHSHLRHLHTVTGDYQKGLEDYFKHWIKNRERYGSKIEHDRKLEEEKAAKSAERPGSRAGSSSRTSQESVQSPRVDKPKLMPCRLCDPLDRYQAGKKLRALKRVLDMGKKSLAGPGLKAKQTREIEKGLRNAELSHSEPESCNESDMQERDDKGETDSDDYDNKDAYPAEELLGKMNRADFLTLAGLENVNQKQAKPATKKKQGPGYSMEKSYWNVENDFLFHHKTL